MKKKRIEKKEEDKEDGRGKSKNGNRAGQSQPAKTTGVVTKEQKHHGESVMACISAQSSLPFQ